MQSRDRERITRPQGMRTFPLEASLAFTTSCKIAPISTALPLAQDLLIFLGKLFLNRVERGKFPSSRPIKVSVYILFDEVYIVIDLILMQVALQYVPSYNQDVSIV